MTALAAWMRQRERLVQAKLRKNAREPVTVRLPARLVYQAKALAIFTDRDLQDVIAEALGERLAREDLVAMYRRVRRQALTPRTARQGAAARGRGAQG